MQIKVINQKLEEFLDSAYNRVSRLYENAMYSDEIYKNIKSTANPLIEHIYKVLIYSEDYPDCVNHWCKEIQNFLTTYCRKRLKTSHKTLTTEHIMQIFKEMYLDAGEMQEIFVKTDGKCEKELAEKDIDYDRVYEEIMKVLPNLINYVKNTGKTSSLKIREIIDQIHQF